MTLQAPKPWTIYRCVALTRALHRCGELQTGFADQPSMYSKVRYQDHHQLVSLQRHSVPKEFPGTNHCCAHVRGLSTCSVLVLLYHDMDCISPQHVAWPCAAAHKGSQNWSSQVYLEKFQSMLYMACMLDAFAVMA